MNKLFVPCAIMLCISASVANAGGHIETASAILINKDGDKVGKAELTQGAKGVLIHVKVHGMTPGKHGLHLHSHGVCEADEGFKTAKGHVGKVEGGHGLLNPNGPEAGDIPNIFIGADGTGEMEAYSSRITLDGGDNALLDADGSSFVIHEGADDHVSQPIGGAGGRVACGIIKHS